MAPVQCKLCSLFLYSLKDVSRHCSFHPTIDLICHHCLTNFDSKQTVAAHMNQKRAHLRLPYDPATYDAALMSPAPSTSAVLPPSQPAKPSVPASPPLTVATLSDVSFDQLLRDLDTSVAAGTDVSAPSVPPPQAASSLPSSSAVSRLRNDLYCVEWGVKLYSLTHSSAVSPTVGARPQTTVSYPPDEYVQLRQQNTEQKFLIWWCLHHLKSLPTPPPSAGGEFDMALRRVLRQTAITPSQFDETSSFTDMVNQLYDLHVGTVTKFP